MVEFVLDEEVLGVIRGMFPDINLSREQMVIKCPLLQHTLIVVKNSFVSNSTFFTIE